MIKLKELYRVLLVWRAAGDLRRAVSSLRELGEYTGKYKQQALRVLNTCLRELEIGSGIVPEQGEKEGGGGPAGTYYKIDGRSDTPESVTVEAEDCPLSGCPCGNWPEEEPDPAYICGSCAVKMGGRFPSDHLATMHYSRCFYCQERDGLSAVDDWDWPDGSNRPEGPGGGRD